MASAGRSRAVIHQALTVILQSEIEVQGVVVAYEMIARAMDA